MTGGFVIEPLGAHDRSAFSCGAAALDRYLREQASQDVKRLMASCFVVVETETKALAGYYTLAATSVPASDLPPETLKRLPRYPVLPAALVGRLAIDRHFHHKGLGSALLADAALRVLKGDTKAFALIVDAKDENALTFYRHQGFRPFASRPLSLFLPIETAKKGASS
ncbi:GNAT family N-acetyltransferase [Rhodoblastus acidophilus]|uniref:GNAT family N-acetyltransferase n=1 Tax=Candidatus Rhodoblastus alkanivorans TaxID=2954117 RepID=UPI001FA94F44|nr:GNAT family N-acetyltransferase [Candidatus Rhodoblastus alkanivorans]